MTDFKRMRLVRDLGPKVSYFPPPLHIRRVFGKYVDFLNNNALCYLLHTCYLGNPFKFSIMWLD